MEHLRAVWPRLVEVMVDAMLDVPLYLLDDRRIEAFPDSMRTITDRPHRFETGPIETPVAPWRLRQRRRIARRRRRNHLRRQTRRLQRPNPYPRRIRNSPLTRLAWDLQRRRPL